MKCMICGKERTTGGKTMNHITLIGRLTKDPELRYTPSGSAVCNFTLAVDRQFANQNGQKETDFIPIVVWNKAAENCAQYLAKGRQVAVAGRLQIRANDGNDGQKRWATEVIAQNVQFLSSGKSNENQNASSSQQSIASYSHLGEEIIFDEAEMPF